MFVDDILPYSLSPQACFICVLNMHILHFHQRKDSFHFSLKHRALSSYPFHYPLLIIDMGTKNSKLTAISDEEWQLTAPDLGKQQRLGEMGKLDCLCPCLKRGEGHLGGSLG